jgi:hypothetical protein
MTVTPREAACHRTMSQRTLRTVLLLAVACVSLLAFASSAMARSQGDRNHDRIPDRWERANHLSLKVNQAKHDQDHDGLRNRAEFLAGTNPHNNDSDDDGTKDGAEDAGTITSFTAGTAPILGVLTIHLFTGDDVKGTVDANTEIQCEQRSAGQPTARTASEGPGGGGDNQGDDGQGENQQGSGQQGDVQQGNGQHGDDDGNDQGDDDNGQAGCDATALTAGAIVREADLKATSTGLVFREIKLVVA